ncbi:hypothetical protein SAMN04488048_1367 [Trichococcus flocculiformis]|nr:Hypothetical protein TES5_2826 [Trichococcus sp. ES5]SHG18642.1 hypothetical protein SAMN04488048_1367 [Trichococcus flocculiformis]
MGAKSRSSDKGSLRRSCRAYGSPSAPTRTRSPKKNELLSPQLRPTVPHRRTADYRKPTSVEKGTHRRKT